jgi:diguanylate cyclase (GGDEF)-like protein
MYSKKLNLSKQLLKSILIIYILITLLVTAIHFFIEYKYTKSHIKDELKTIASIFEPALQTALWDLNNEQLESISNGMLNMPLIYSLVITDPNRTEIIDKGGKSFSKKNIPDDDLSYTFKIHQKFNGNSIYLANVTIYSDDDAIYNRIKLGLMMILLNALITTAALVVLFMIAFGTYLEKPLQELTKKISGLDWENKENRHINVEFENKNELSILQSKFNQLLAKISKEEERRFELINTQKIQLEYDVKNRTLELEEANVKLQKLATTDVLTQLNNRSKIDEELTRKYNNFKRNKRIFSVIMVDIDFFKNINDEHGHQVGDYVLKSIANILKENVRKIDVVGRWGGEEFFIICGETDIEGAYILAEHIRKIIEAYQFDYIEHKTASFGIAQIEEGYSIDTLIKKADDALYEAKNSGRNKSVKDKNS